MEHMLGMLPHPGAAPRHEGQRLFFRISNAKSAAAFSLSFFPYLLTSSVTDAVISLTQIYNRDSSSRFPPVTFKTGRDAPSPKIVELARNHPTIWRDHEKVHPAVVACTATPDT